MKNKVFLYSIVTVVTIMIMGVSASILGYMPIGIQKGLEEITGWGTLISLAICILFAFDFEKFITLTVFERVGSIIANTALFLMYASYLLVDYGSLSPHVSAIGFNVAELLRNGLIFWLMFKMILIKNK